MKSLNLILFALLFSFTSLATVGSITGSANVCLGSTILLTDTTVGGLWSSSNLTVASVGSVTGYVTGVSAGIATISYTVGGSYATISLTVNPLPLPIIGGIYICAGTTTNLSDSTPGGTWSSGTLSIATIGSVTGSVTGAGAGSAVIHYTLPTGCSVTAVVNVLPTTPPPLGCNNVGIGDTTTLLGSPGGIFTSFNPSIATVTSSGGKVTGVSVGTALIFYSSGAGCGSSISVTVTPYSLIHSINGNNIVCNGSSMTLSDGISGGVWSSYNPAIATISSLGIVTGISANETIITYSISGGVAICTKPIFVYPLPSPITGPTNVCADDTIDLHATAPDPDYGDVVTYAIGGWFTPSNPGIASIAHATYVDGWIKGITPGIDTITYTDVNGPHCSVTTIVTVNPSADVSAIMGSTHLCTGDTTTLSDTGIGGVWSSSNPSVATINAPTGKVIAISSGTTNIAYSISNSCGTGSTNLTLTVNPTPSPIVGADTVCTGSSVTLSNLINGGTWSSSDTTITIVDLLTGVETGIHAGSTSVTYTLGTGCAIAKIIRVNPLPVIGMITGAASECVTATIILTDSIVGGVWGTANGNATVSGGLVTGVMAGIDTISYSVTNSCGIDIASKAVTINPLPVAGTIVGLSNVCVGGMITLTDVIPGGIWSSINGTAIASGDTITGIIAGMDTISYSVTNSCGTDIASKAVTINPLPIAGTITGVTSICVAASAILTDSTTGGIWGSINGNAIVSGSIVTGAMAGIDTIRYSVTNVCGTAIATKTITINPLPYAGNIVGMTHVCVGSFTTLIDTTSGGIWSSNNTTATVAGGIVTGITSGLDTINYSTTNVCGTAIAMETLTVNPLPAIYNISGGGSYCSGSIGVPIGLSGSDTGISYQLYNGTTITGGFIAGTSTALDFGIFAAADTYSVKAQNIYTGCENNMAGVVTVAILASVVPTVTIIASPGTHIGVGMYDTLISTVTSGGSSPAYQWYINGTLIPGATTSTYVSNTFFDGDSVFCQVTSSEECGTTAANYAIITISSTGINNMQMSQNANVQIYPNPAQDEITIEYNLTNNKDAMLQITDVTGRMIATKNISNQKQKELIDISDFIQGIYFYKVVQDKFILSIGKLIKE